MSESAAAQSARDVPLIWVGGEERDVLLANQFLVQLSHDREVFFTLGVLTPPPLLGTPEEQLKQMERITHVEIQALARFVLSGDNARKLHDILGQLLTHVDEKSEEGGQR